MFINLAFEYYVELYITGKLPCQTVQRRFINFCLKKN